MEKDMMHCHGGFGGKHTYMLLGVLVFVWGFMNYLMVVHGWTSYAAWMVGGIILVLVGWFKKWWYMRQGM